MRFLTPSWMKKPAETAKLTDPEKLREVLLCSSQIPCRLQALNKLDDQAVLASALESEEELLVLNRIMDKMTDGEALYNAMIKNTNHLMQSRILDRLLKCTDPEAREDLCARVMNDPAASEKLRLYAYDCDIRRREQERNRLKEQAKKEAESRRLHCIASPDGRHHWVDIPGFDYGRSDCGDHQTYYTQKRCTYCGKTDEEMHIVYTDY